MTERGELTSSRLLARNSILNLFGSIAPTLVAFVAIPVLVKGLGTDRFGVLTIAWTLIGYFSLFDFGLSRALTQLVADRLGGEREQDIPRLAWTALLLMTLLGAVGAVVLGLLAPWLAYGVLKIPEPLHAESTRAFLLLALCLPCVTSTAGLRGMLEANQSFGMVNAIRIPMGVVTYAAPVLVLPFSHSLVPLVAALVVGRAIAWVAHLVCCLIAFPALRSQVRIDRSTVGALTRFGGWMTMANLSGTLMAYLDRFVIGASVSMAAVAYYVTPYEAITKLWLFPGALMGVLFPAFAVSFARDPLHTRRLLDRAFRLVFLGLFPVTVVVVAFAREGLRLWVGAEFAASSAGVLQWLAVGVLINSVGMVTAAGLQGVGRPDLTGKLSLLELPFYLALLWLLLRSYGIVGAAMAWTARVAVDTALLFLLTDRVVSRDHFLTRRMATSLAPAVGVLGALALLHQGVRTKLVVVGVLAVVFAVYAWVGLLTAEERQAVHARLTPRRRDVASSF